jgi:hypothetical protein
MVFPWYGVAEYVDDVMRIRVKGARVFRYHILKSALLYIYICYYHMLKICSTYLSWA